MVIKKDPESLPDHVVDFVDVYSDINSPQYWIAISDEDLQPSLLVLDGHSTILIYTQDDEELQWEAIHELGQYKYTPDKIGDGIVVFPHTFYLEFQIELTDKILDVNANFDGTGIRAISMPFKEVDIINFVDELTERISDIFTSALKKHDDKLSINVGEPLKIPDNILDATISFKLGLIGTNLQKINVVKVTEVDLPEEDIQEEIFEVPEMVEEEEEEVDEQIPQEKEVAAEETSSPQKGKVPPPKKPSGPPMPKKQASSGAPAPGGGAPAPKPSAPSPTGPPTPTTTKSKGSGPPSPKSSAPSPGGPPTPGSSRSVGADKTAVEVDAGTKAPSTIPSAPVPGGESSKKKKSSSAKRSRKMEAAPVPETEGLAFDADLDSLEEEVKPKSDDTNLYARGMDTKEEASSLRNTHTTWFSRMIPNRAYPLLVNITTEELKTKKTVTSHTTGEARSEQADEITVDTTKDLIIKPEFPGCLVVPQQRVVDSNENNITARFHVTPLALGSLDSKIVFEQGGEEIHAIELETKVIKHRISRISATIGALTGSLPAIFAFMFEQSPQEFMNSRMDHIAVLSGLGYLVPLLFSGLFFAIAAGFYFIQKPQSSDKSISFPK